MIQLKDSQFPKFSDIPGCKACMKQVSIDISFDNILLVAVFTDQEKQKVDSEFAYYNFKHDENNNPAGEIIHTDPFTEQMLNST